MIGHDLARDDVRTVRVARILSDIACATRPEAAAPLPRPPTSACRPRRVAERVAAGAPGLGARSTKDFVGESLDLPVGERLTGTLAATAIAAWHGARIFRPHAAPHTRPVVARVDVILAPRPIRRRPR